MKKLLFVYNPHSGKCQILNHLAEIIDIFTKGGYEVTVHPTQARDDAANTVRSRAKDFDLVVSSGGDGTTNETIKGIMESGCEVPVGIIPAGTMNDFASSIGIPKYMPDAAHIIAGGTPRFVDIGSFNGSYFTYVAAFGVFTHVSYATDQQLKNTWGALAYMTAAIREALQKGELNQKYTITVECNGQSITDDFIFGMVSNSLSVGGIKGLAGTDVQMNDGIFEGIFIKKPASLIELQQTLNALLKNEFDTPYFYYFKSSDFRFRTDGNVPWTLDGEYGGTEKDISVRVVHNVLRITVDSSKAAGLSESANDE